MPSAICPRARRHGLHDWRNADDWYRGDRRQGVSDEGGAYPDLVEVGKPIVPLCRERWQLPVPDANVVAVLEVPIAELVHDLEVLARIDADEVHIKPLI